MPGTLTSRGLTLLVGGAALWLVGRLLGVTELSIVAVTSIALVGASGLAVMLATPAIFVRRMVVTPRLDYGARGEIAVTLRSDKRLYSTTLLVEDTCHLSLLDHPTDARFVVPAGLGPGQAVSLRYPITGIARGRYAVGPLRIRVRDPFGLARRTRLDSAIHHVLVYPRIEALPSGAIRGQHLGRNGSALHRRLFAPGDEFSTLREYSEGDDPRHIHWPSTAHRQTLMVRQHEQTWQARACVFLDARRSAHTGGGPDSTLEKAICVAASLVTYLAAHGFQLRLATEADHRGAAAYEDRARILERLAELQPSPVPGLGPALERARDGQGLLIVIVRAPARLDASADVRALLRAGHARTGRIALVIASGPGDHAADALAGMLRSAGWKATTIAPTASLASRWAWVR